MSNHFSMLIIFIMGNCVCAKLQPIEIRARQQENTPDTNERYRLCLLVFENKTRNAPKLKIENNSLYMRRKYIYEELVEVHEN